MIQSELGTDNGKVSDNQLGYKDIYYIPGGGVLGYKDIFYIPVACPIT